MGNYNTRSYMNLGIMHYKFLQVKPLMRAVEAMDMDTITSLLEAGVDPNIEVYKTLHVIEI